MWVSILCVYVKIVQAVVCIFVCVCKYERVVECGYFLLICVLEGNCIFCDQISIKLFGQTRALRLILQLQVHNFEKKSFRDVDMI